MLICLLEIRDQSELYAIPHRHTNRGPYDPHKPLSRDFLDALSRLPTDQPDIKIFLFTLRRERTQKPVNSVRRRVEGVHLLLGMARENIELLNRAS